MKRTIPDPWNPDTVMDVTGWAPAVLIFVWVMHWTRKRHARRAVD